jgi:hypothetical protein
MDMDTGHGQGHGFVSRRGQEQNHGAVKLIHNCLRLFCTYKTYKGKTKHGFK